MKGVPEILALVSLLIAVNSFSLKVMKSFSPKSFSKSIMRARFGNLFMATTEKPVQLNSMDTMVGGMFTNSSPETKRVVPKFMEGKTKFKIVYVVLESQYQSALTKACNAINSGKEPVAVEAVGYLLEELRNPKVFEQFKADVADANIFIGSLIFVEELADKVSGFVFETILFQMLIFLSRNRSLRF